MRSSIHLLLLFTALAIGCSNQTIDTTVTPPVSVTATSSDATAASTGSEAESGVDAMSTSGTEIALSPSNTLIQFVGTHVGEVPDPKARTGNFEEFAGTAAIADDELKAVTVEIQMGSVQTGMDKLNNHLQNEDFFSVREYPTAKFESTRIARNEDGDHIITGNLTLHSETNEISFPAVVGMIDGDLNLSGKLKLDRTEFGMDKMTDKVNKEVNLTIRVGKDAR